MQHRALGLQSRPQQIEWIHHCRTNRPAQRPNGARCEIADRHIRLVAAEQTRPPRQEERFQLLEDEEVDGAVGEHAG